MPFTNNHEYSVFGRAGRREVVGCGLNALCEAVHRVAEWGAGFIERTAIETAPTGKPRSRYIPIAFYHAEIGWWLHAGASTRIEAITVRDETAELATRGIIPLTGYEMAEESASFVRSQHYLQLLDHHFEEHQEKE